MSFFLSIFCTIAVSLCIESTSYVFPFREVFFYLVITDWIFDISLFENSMKKTSNNSIERRHVNREEFRE